MYVYIFLAFGDMYSLLYIISVSDLVQLNIYAIGGEIVLSFVFVETSSMVASR